MSLWEGLKSAAAKAGNAAMLAGTKTKLQGEIMLIDREIKGLKQKFGVDLYNHLGPLATSPDFFASDDPLTETLRPPLLTAQREIAALEIRRRKAKEDIKQAEVKRAAAFPDKAITFADKAKNAAKSAALASNEAKLSTDLSVIETQMKQFKQKFGEDIFDIFVALEDSKGWLPTDRTIRSMYDNARQAVEKAIKKKKEKIAELESLGGSYADKKADTGYDAPVAPATSDTLPVASSSAPPPAAAPMSAAPLPTPSYPVSNDPKVQGLFATPDNPAPDLFSAPAQPAVSGSNTGLSSTAFPIAQSSSYMTSTTTGTTTSGVMGGYPGNTTMGGYSDAAGMGSFVNTPVMGGSGYSDQGPMGGSAGMMGGQPATGGFSDFSGMSGTGGFPPQQTMMGGFQQQPNNNSGMDMFQPPPQQSNNAFGGFPNAQSGNKPSGQPDDLLF